MTVYQVVYWSHEIKQQDRKSTNVSDGAVFSDQQVAADFAARVVLRGGAICAIRSFDNPTSWLESLEEYDRLGLMTVDELVAIRDRGKQQA